MTPKFRADVVTVIIVVVIVVDVIVNARSSTAARRGVMLVRSEAVSGDDHTGC